MNCQDCPRPQPLRVVAVVVLSVVAFVGQALGTPTGADADPATAIASISGSTQR